MKIVRLLEGKLNYLATNLSALARDVGVNREGLRKALSPEGNPSFALMLKITHALRLEVQLAPAVSGRHDDEVDAVRTPG